VAQDKQCAAFLDSALALLIGALPIYTLCIFSADLYALTVK